MLRLPTLRWLPFLIGSDRKPPPRTGTWHRTPERPILKIRASKLPVRFRPRLCQAIHVHFLEIYQKVDGLLPPQSRLRLQKLYCAYNDITAPSFNLTGAPFHRTRFEFAQLPWICFVPA